MVMGASWRHCGSLACLVSKGLLGLMDQAREWRLVGLNHTGIEGNEVADVVAEEDAIETISVVNIG